MKAPEPITQILMQDYDVSRETLQKLSLYHDLLTHWQKKINLISPTTVNDIWQRHILDSAQLASHVKGKSLLDIGSGAGFPGLVLAMMRECHVTLVESDQRKCVFLTEVARQTKTRVTIRNERIEKLPAQTFDTITARACASLEELFQMAQNFCGADTICLFPKGKNYSMELEAARTGWRFGAETIPSRTDSQSFIIKINNLTQITAR